MRRDFLKELGIEDKETINKILDENSADIGRAKVEVDDLKSEVSKLKTQLADKTTEFDNLKESTKDYNDLADKIKQLDLDNAQLVADKKQLEIERDTKVSEVLKSHAIENSIRDSKAKNIKAVMALLDMEKIKYENNTLSGVSEQLEALKGGEDTSFLFGDTNPAPVGTNFNNPPSGGGKSTPKTFSEAIAAAIANQTK